MENFLPRDLWRRQTNLLDGQIFAKRYQVTSSAIARLGLETTLKEHSGCVNCLAWSHDGQLLASGSDDLKVVIWQPFQKKPKSTAIVTEHRGNIFSVKFMPHTSNTTVVSGAADHMIQIHDVMQEKTVSTFSNHMKRVKRLDVAQGCPNIVWSASEDGTVMQTDIRAKPDEVHVLVNLMSIMGKGAEAKCVSVNPTKPEWIAVGCNDPYVRVFDRRQMKAKLIEFPADVELTYDKRQYLSTEPNCVNGASLSQCSKYFVPGHLQQMSKKRRRRLLTVTYTTFSPDGSELLVNMGGEQVYLYDINDPTPKLVDTTDFCGFMQQDRTPEGSSQLSENPLHVNGVTSRVPKMSEEAERLKALANTDFGKEEYSKAIMQYNQALLLCGSTGHPVLYANRAAAYMKRKWDGDLYAALRDCLKALKVDKGHAKAHLRLCRCLLELKWVDEAQGALELFKSRFAEHASGAACVALAKDISDVIRDMSSSESAASKAAEPMPSLEDDLSSSFDEDDDDEMGGSSSHGGGGRSAPLIGLKNPEERFCRNSSRDYQARFAGHCNTTTDIKEANFFGNEGQFIVAGSDDGKFYCWDRRSTNIRKVLAADESIVNCLQPHPSACLLASSGIESVVRLWAPSPEDGSVNDREVIDFEADTSTNQERMNADPFASMLREMGMGIQLRQGRGDENGSDEDGENPLGQQVQCRQS